MKKGKEMKEDFFIMFSRVYVFFFVQFCYSHGLIIFRLFLLIRISRHQSTIACLVFLPAINIQQFLGLKKVGVSTIIFVK